MKVKIITNNPLIFSTYSNEYDVVYEKISYKKILNLVRDYIHKGHKLLTHPLSGSIKPNETPFKTILVSCVSNNLDIKSLSIIEQSIETADKFTVLDKKYSKDIERDFMEIDLSLIENVINRLY